MAAAEPRAATRAGLARALRRQRWLLARRALQFGLLAAFAGAPWVGPPVLQGTLAASTWFGTLTLVDPMVALQSLVAGHALAPAGLAGAALVAACYALLAGRLYCGWVCPINLVTDAAAWLRRMLGLRPGGLWRVDRRLRRLVLLLALATSAAAGSVAWEWVNPIGWTVRALAFGLWAGGLAAAAAVFVIDLVVLRHGWCGHLCPVGAFYGLLGRFGRLNLQAARPQACTQCGACYAVCPEPQVIAPVLRPGAVSRIVTDVDCLRCGRCIDHCDEDVFALRLQRRAGPAVT